MATLLRALLRMTSHRSLLSMITAASALIIGSLTLTTGSQRAVASGATYYVAADGYDSNPGTLDLPWRTIGHALKQLYAGDTLYIRGGTYTSPSGGWYLIHSGTADQPITLTNHPGEQVVVKVNEVGIWYSPFVCNSEGSGQKADYVRLMGSDVNPRTLSNGLSSSKGIVIQGPDTGYTDAAGVRIWDCDYWEVAGLDLIRMGYGLFGHTFGNDHWYVHHNRVYSNSREAGMQFNGPHHTIEYNEVIRDRPDYQSPYGCSHIALLAYGNDVGGNVLDYVQPMRNQQGNLVHCVGILLEWDIADDNIIEGNVIRHMDKAFDFAGGDNNIVRNNIILTGNSGYVDAGFYIRAYPDGTNSWPCNNEWLQPSNPSDPAYAHFWNPRNCHSRDNQIYNNVVVGFKKGVLFDNRIPEGNTYVRNNAFVHLSEGGICNWSRCGSFDGVTEDHNVFNAPYDFVDEAHEDFHLLPTSPLRDAGYYMGDLVPTDLDGSPRPQGAAYDVGAYEYPGESLPTATPSPIPTSTPTTAPTATATSTPTATPTTASTATATSTATASPTTAPTATATSTPTATPTAAPTAAVTPSPTPTPITAPTATEMSTPTATPTTAPAATATPSPTATPTAANTSSPSPTPNPNEIIIDDTDAGFSTTFSQDAWEEYAQAAGRHYGGSHYYNRKIGTGQDTAMWSFDVPVPGRYDVYAWWWEANWRPTDVAYTVNHLGGSTVVRVNQQTNGGQWNLLGTFEFLDQGSVVVSDDTSSGQDVVADAVRLVYLEPSPSATPTTTSTATAIPNPTATPTTATAATAIPNPTAIPTAANTSSPTPNPNETIIDDTDAGFSTTFSQDAWEEYVQAGGRHYGGSHYYNHRVGTGQDTAMWSFHVPVPGRYEVYAWWWEGNWRPTDVAYIINHLGGSTVVRVNQQTDGGRWNLLGTFEFLGQGSVVVCDDPSSGQDVVADAVRVVYLEPSTWHGKYRMFFPVVRSYSRTRLGLPGRNPH